MLQFNVLQYINGQQQQSLQLHEAEIIEKLVFMTCMELYGNIKQFTPVDHGRLRSSFQIMKDNNLSFRIVSGVVYGPFTDLGTGIYGPNRRPIHPKTANVLRFYIGNKAVFATEVKGQKGADFTNRAINATERRIDDFLQTILAQY